jgi:hypothetical protein
MIDAFLLFFLVSLVPIAFIGLGARTEHAIFVAWRVAQLATLALSFAWILYRLARGRWTDWLLLVAISLLVAFIALSYVGIAWDSQIEYQRVLLLAERYGGLTEAYRHGVTSWILGYPPGTSLSVAWYRWLRLPSPNVAQGVLFALWSTSLLVRHMRSLDVASKLLFFVLLVSGPLFLWHLTYFYNNLFYALIWGQLILAPMFGSSLRPWERCGYALVLVWLRPQWQIAAIPIGSAALATLLSEPTFDRRCLYETVLATLAALCVAWLGATYWQTAAARLTGAQDQVKSAILDDIAAHQDQRSVHVDVTTKTIERQSPPKPALWSKQSADAITWAYGVTKNAYAISLLVLAGVALLGLLSLRRGGLVFVVPLLSPLALIVGTAIFARSYPEYRANKWALERLQIIAPILAAGAAAALHHAYRIRTRS